MDLPACYDPVRQEEERQEKWDNLVENLPVCDCCFKSVYPNEMYYPLTVQKKRYIMCADCKSSLDDSGIPVEM